jgi:hypothetical protein
MSQFLSVVKPQTTYKRPKYKITLWLAPEEYTAVMKMSADLDNGKVSFHKWFKKIIGIENAKTVMDKRSVAAQVRRMHKPLAARRQARAAA